MACAFPVIMQMYLSNARVALAVVVGVWFMFAPWVVKVAQMGALDKLKQISFDAPRRL